jgi:V8-like Glu-specific endopeptidase
VDNGYSQHFETTEMRQLLLVVLLVLAGESFALPPCPSGVFDNCYGTLTDPADGTKYIGEFKNGYMHGQGTYTLVSGSKYIGEWKDGYMHGQGALTSASGDEYVGEFKDGKKHGQGTKTWANGDEYVGEWKDNKKHGQGTYISANGDEYVGEFKDEKPHGQGTKTYANGDKYVGEFKDNRMHGQGTFTMASGSKYVGEFKDDRIHGQGIFTVASGDQFIGEWKEGRLHGQVAIAFANGDKWVGEFKDGKKHGQGTKTWANGTTYVGEFKDGKKHGQGTKTWANGDEYVGEFRNDKQWEGIEYAPSGKVRRTISSGKWCGGCKPTARQLAIVREIKTNKKLIGTGTGFVVNKYYVVTAEHVLENCNAITVRHGHHEIDAQTAARDASNDLGLIRLQKPIANTAKLRGGNRIRLGEMVANYGYPLFGQLSTSATITEGNINNLSGAGNDSTVLQFDAPTQPGNSGGPLLDSSGNVVGVAIKILSKKYADATGHIAQNVNFAVKSNIVENFLQSNNIAFQIAASTKRLELPDIAEKAERFTVLVGCWE